MTILAKLLISAAVFLGLATLGYAYRMSVYREGFASGQRELKDSIEKRNAEIARLNKQLVAKDQEVISAKEEDKERITTVYKTIRSQVEPVVIKEKVYTDCRVGKDVFAAMQSAAEGISSEQSQAAANSP